MPFPARKQLFRSGLKEIADKLDGLPNEARSVLTCKCEPLAWMMTTSLFREEIIMKKIKLGTSDGATENAKRITELFPQVVTEIKSADGEIERTIDFDALRDLLGDVVEGQRERYQFTWPGKRELKQRRVAPSIRR